jgi:large subunit ribosomal protein L28
MATLKRAQRGLYGGKTKLFGNQKSHSMRHSRRTWSPNVHSKRLWSDALNMRVRKTFFFFLFFFFLSDSLCSHALLWQIRVKITTSVLRTIDFYGGLDNYLLETSDAKIDSIFGVQLKQAIKQAKRREKKNNVMQAKG